MSEKRVSKLKSAIYEKFPNESACARALGWERQKLNNISLGKSRPNVDDINDLSKVLGKSIGEIVGFFCA